MSDNIVPDMRKRAVELTDVWSDHFLFTDAANFIETLQAELAALKQPRQLTDGECNSVLNAVDDVVALDIYRSGNDERDDTPLQELRREAIRQWFAKIQGGGV